MKPIKRATTSPKRMTTTNAPWNLTPSWPWPGPVSACFKLNTGAVSEATEYFTRAYQLSDNVSEREKLYIAGHYYSTVVGDLNKSIETLQVATQEYPLQVDNFINLGVFYLANGDIEKSDAANRKALDTAAG